MELTTEGGTLDSWHGRVGFRSVRLDCEPDPGGTSFSLVVNDRPVFVRGANWIPDDAFVHRVTRERYHARVEQAHQVGVNLLRVCGGGIFESDDFYDMCDERGILVWQDFLFACAAYAEEECSLALWNGNNENIWGYEDWGWAQRLEGRSWGMGYYADVLPGLLAELDPTRPYSVGSPCTLATRGARTTPTTGRRTSGTSGTIATTALTGNILPGSSPSSGGRGQRPGRRWRDRCRTTR